MSYMYLSTPVHGVVNTCVPIKKLCTSHPDGHTVGHVTNVVKAEVKVQVYIQRKKVPLVTSVLFRLQTSPSFIFHHCQGKCHSLVMVCTCERKNVFP